MAIQASTLSDEDALRLNVLMAGEVQAIRLDDGTMTLYALTPRGEATVRLSPNCAAGPYLKKVREFLAGQVLGSPGGYPVYIQRWTRMGQAREQGLDKLLLLGEPEAAVSVAYSPGLTDELARLAWWAMPAADNARRMLERACVQEGAMGKVLAEFLVEHLPFETEPHTIIDTVRIVLQPGLIDDAMRQRLWNKARHNSTYLVGFLERMADRLPDPQPSRRETAAILEPLADNPWAAQLLRLLDGPGQAFLATVEDVLKRPADQDVVNALFNAVGAYFALPGHPAWAAGTVEAMEAEADRRLAEPTAQAVLAASPQLESELRALLFLSQVDSELARPIFRTTTAIGTLMRRKLEPITGPIQKRIAVLRGKGR
jgi:hypothetical protein